MSPHFNLTMTDTVGGDVEPYGTTTVEVSFDTDSLDHVIEQIFWFLQRSGYSYVTKLTAEKPYGDVSFEFR